MASAAEKARWQPTWGKNSTSNDDAERADQASALLPTTAVLVEVVSNTALRSLSMPPERPTKGWERARGIVKQEYRAQLALEIQNKRHWMEVASVENKELEALKKKSEKEKDKLAAALIQVDELEKDLEDTQNNLENASEAAHQLGKVQEQMKQSTDETEAALKVSQKQLAEGFKDMDAGDAKVAKKIADLESKLSKSKVTKQALKKTVANLERDLVAAGTELASAKGKVVEVEKSLEESKAKSNALGAQNSLDEAKKEIAEVEDKARNYKDAFVVFALRHETESERAYARDRAHNLSASLEAKAAAADASNQAVTAREYEDMSNTIKFVEERLQKKSAHDEDTVKALKAQLCNAEAELLNLRQKTESDGAEMITLRQKIDSDGTALDALTRLTCHVSTLATPQLQQHRGFQQNNCMNRLV